MDHLYYYNTYNTVLGQPPADSAEARTGSAGMPRYFVFLIFIGCVGAVLVSFSLHYDVMKILITSAL